MNCNLDGTLLSTDDLFAIAVADGADPADLRATAAAIHSGAGIRSMLSARSADRRFAMFAAGELVLDTRPRPRPDAGPPAVDADVLAFLVARTVTA